MSAINGNSTIPVTGPCEVLVAACDQLEDLVTKVTAIAQPSLSDISSFNTFYQALNTLYTNNSSTPTSTPTHKTISEKTRSMLQVFQQAIAHAEKRSTVSAPVKQPAPYAHLEGIDLTTFVSPFSATGLPVVKDYDNFVV